MRAENDSAQVKKKRFCIRDVVGFNLYDLTALKNISAIDSQPRNLFYSQRCQKNLMYK